MRLTPMERNRLAIMPSAGRNICRRVLHQEENEDGWTRREYIEVNGTENAYDFGLDVGKSINTPSVWGCG